MSESSITGCILGTATGDALGLPYEGVSRKRIPQLLGPPDRHRFLFRRGMVSDDTEHTCMVAQSLIACGGDAELFRRDFACRLRWWLAKIPAGIGLATLRACLKLWIGVSPDSSGVFSAGNGPAMRAAIFGATFQNVSEMASFVRASTVITHSDPKAEYGAMAVALAAHFNRRDSEIESDQYLRELSDVVGPPGEELIELLRIVAASVSMGESTLTYAMNNGSETGVSGYVYRTVPVAIHAWLSTPHNYRSAVTAVIECGGDSDTTAAIVGGIVGAGIGEKGIPAEWLNSICEWPRSNHWMRRLSCQLSQSVLNAETQRPIRLNFVAELLRNFCFTIIVLFHGFRRLLPPY